MDEEMKLVNKKYLNKCWICQGPADTCTDCASKAVAKAREEGRCGTIERTYSEPQHLTVESSAGPSPKPAAPKECDLCDGEGKYLDAFHMGWLLCEKCGGTVETKAAAAAYAAAEKASTPLTNSPQLDEATVAAVERRADLISDQMTRQELQAFLNEVRTMQADNRSMRAESLEMTRMLARIVEAHAGARSGDEREAILEAAVWFRRRGGPGQGEHVDGGEKL
jgi:hypothetical protein